MSNGFIKIDRALRDWRYKTCPNYVALWLEILLKANWEEKQWQDITIPKGSFVTSLDHLVKDTGLSKMQVRTILNKLDGQEITQTSTHKYTLIKVNKWEQYQCSDVDNNTNINTQITHKQHSDNTQITLTKEIKEYKENKEYILGEKSKRFIPPTIEEISSYCKERNNSVDSTKFFNFYESKGWFVGKNKMKDWKAAVRTWEQKESKEEESFGKDYYHPNFD